MVIEVKLGAGGDEDFEFRALGDIDGHPFVEGVDAFDDDRLVFADVDAYLSSRVRYAVSNGISPEKIIVDPGVGFGKGLRENAALIARAGSLCGGKYPVLMALSMKTCIGQMTGKDTEDRLIGTVAANLLSVVKGASLVRVHDVGSCIESLDVLKCLLENGFGEM